MTIKQTVRSTCARCTLGCGILVHLEEGRAIKIEGDPSSPISKGELCVKGLAGLEYVYHSNRLKHPLKRVGKRGEAKFQEITWEEALSRIAEELDKARNIYGAESVAFIRGAGKGYQCSYLPRFANVFGSPNSVMNGHVCHLPKIYGSMITCGFNPDTDYEGSPNCIIVWGHNPAETNLPKNMRIAQALDSGTKLIVVDPRAIDLARRADLWLRLRPGSDLALALGMIHVIINKGLCNKAFVDKWTVGFDELRGHIQDYPPEKVAELTWIPANKIREAAMFYAQNKPACIEQGNATEHNINSVQTARALSILRAITGNLGIPGGELKWAPLPILTRRSPELELRDKMPVEKWQRRLGAEYKTMPLLRYVITQSLVKAILEEDPYPIHVTYVQGANPLVTYSNARETYRAFMKLGFSVVSDLFMTPTAALADIVLPAASCFEFDSIVQSDAYPIACCQQKVAQVGECWSDYKMLSELAKRLGLGGYFWETEEQCLDALLKPAGLTFEEFKQVGWISGHKQYREYERGGFATPSGKVELYSHQLKEWGFDPLPTFYEMPETPYSDPELAREYPLIYTSYKSVHYRHSGGRQITSLRGGHPEPTIYIHPETAKELGIQESDSVYIETNRGRIIQKAAFEDTIDPRIVIVDYAWWFPERGESELYGWADSNINILTNNNPPYSPEIGSMNLRGIMCKVYKVS